MTNLPLVSVLTPVYNEEAFVEECLNSVLSQTYSNWRMVVVDNASQDRTFEIVQRYVAKDSRISVVRNPSTVPILSNYNIAFRLVPAEAKYCKVIAGDDWLFPACLQEMVALAESNPGVGLIGAYSLGRAGGIEPHRFPFAGDVVSGRDVTREYLLQGAHLVGAPTPLMYRADLVRRTDPFLHEDKLHSDAEVCLRILAEHEFGFVRQVLTCTRDRAGSTTSFADRYDVYLPNRLEFLAEFGPQCVEHAELQRVFAGVLRDYYNRLGEAAARGRDKEYWDYHRRRLTALGRPLSRSRVMWNAVTYWMEAVTRRLRRLG